MLDASTANKASSVVLIPPALTIKSPAALESNVTPSTCIWSALNVPVLMLPASKLETVITEASIVPAVNLSALNVLILASVTARSAICAVATVPSIIKSPVMKSSLATQELVAESYIHT